MACTPFVCQSFLRPKGGTACGTGRGGLWENWVPPQLPPVGSAPCSVLSASAAKRYVPDGDVGSAGDYLCALSSVSLCRARWWAGAVAADVPVAGALPGAGVHAHPNDGSRRRYMISCAPDLSSAHRRSPRALLRSPPQQTARWLGARPAPAPLGRAVEARFARSNVSRRAASAPPAGG